MNSKKKTIILSSPAGSGNVFCQYLIKSNLRVNFEWKNHDPNAFRDEADTINLFILRDPYDAIASGTELIINEATGNHLADFIADPEAKIKIVIGHMTNSYQEFLNIIENSSNINIVSFEYLTTSPIVFLNKLSSEFDIKFKKYRGTEETIRKYGGDPESIKASIAKNADIHNRVPREKSDLRKTIDSLVNNDLGVAEIHKNYLKQKVDIQLTGNML